MCEGGRGGGCCGTHRSIQAKDLCQWDARHAEHCAAVFAVVTGLQCNPRVPIRSIFIVLRNRSFRMHQSKSGRAGKELWTRE